MTDDTGLLERADHAAAVIAPLAETIEARGRLPEEAVRALVVSGVFKAMLPRALGGSEASVSVALQMIEALSRADGSAGWCAMIGASTALTSGYVAPELAREIFTADDAITGGVFAPMGRATPVEGGDDGAAYRVRGRWPFASGCEHATWRMGGVLIERASPDASDVLSSGAPHVRCFFFRAEETRVIPTWDVSGLRGTGSHDLEVVDLVVPASRMFSLFDAPRSDAAIHRVPIFGVLAAGVAAVTLGIARAAIDAIVALAMKKTPLGAKRGVAHRELVQLDVARAEAKVRSARAFLYDAVGAVEREPTSKNRALFRLASSNAATESAAAVDLAYNLGGATSIYSKNPLQRHFRDVHVATQHVMVGSAVTTLAGRVLLGLESDTSTL